MKKLELKHLVPYLQHHLIGISPSGNKFYLATSSNMLGKGIENRNIDTFLNDEFKPILRPLSDLTKEIEVNGEKFVPIDRLEDFIDFELGYERVDYWKIQKMFEWHFDVFGLIKKGLAIDFNTL